MNPSDFTPRPIRFRVWDGERMHYPAWTEGGSHLVIASDSWALIGPDGHTLVDDTERGVLLLSTGLTDADGREVFEGDTLASKNDGKVWGTVVWDEPRCGWVILAAKEKRMAKGTWFLMDFLPSMRVVGNVYEKPEHLVETA